LTSYDINANISLRKLKILLKVEVRHS